MKNNRIINIEIFKDNEMERQTSFTYDELVNLGEQIQNEVEFYKNKQDIFNRGATTYLTYEIEGENNGNK